MNSTLLLLVLSRRKVIACTRDARAVVVGGARAADDDGGVRRKGQPANSANVVSSLLLGSTCVVARACFDEVPLACLHARQSDCCSTRGDPVPLLSCVTKGTRPPPTTAIWFWLDVITKRYLNAIG